MASLQRKSVVLYFSNVNHYSLLDLVLRCLKKLDCQVSLLLAEGLTQNIYSASEILLYKKVSNKNFLTSSIFKIFNTSDFIIIDELYSFRELASFSVYSLRRPNVLLIHDCNSWLAPKLPQGIVQKLKYAMTKRVAKKIGYFGVAGENMLNYCKTDLGVKNVTLVPFRYADFDPEKDLPDEFYTRGTPIRMVVPGMVSKRRNYHELLEAVCQEELKTKVELVLLGKPDKEHGQEIISLAGRLVEKGYVIRYWNQFVPSEIFDEEIKNAHLLFSHFDTAYRTNNGQTEIYGISKETGIASLMYNKAKVGLLPKEFNQMETIKNQTITYKSLRELPYILLQIYDGSINLHEKIENAVWNAKTMDLLRIVRNLDESYKEQSKSPISGKTK